MRSCYGFGELVCISVVILHLSAKSLSLFILRSSLQSFDYITQRTSPYCLNLVKQAETREGNEIEMKNLGEAQTIL